MLPQPSPSWLSTGLEARFGFGGMINYRTFDWLEKSLEIKPVPNEVINVNRLIIAVGIC